MFIEPLPLKASSLHLLCDISSFGYLICCILNKASPMRVSWRASTGTVSFELLETRLIILPLLCSVFSWHIQHNASSGTSSSSAAASAWGAKLSAIVSASPLALVDAAEPILLLFWKLKAAAEKTWVSMMLCYLSPPIPLRERTLYHDHGCMASSNAIIVMLHDRSFFVHALAGEYFHWNRQQEQDKHKRAARLYCNCTLHLHINSQLLCHTQDVCRKHSSKIKILTVREDIMNSLG